MSEVKAKIELLDLESAVVRFAGDSGDGMQTVGEQFTDSSVYSGNDISTFPDFPAEIRAPQGTLPGVSGFQIQFGSREILTPGDTPNALVAMNPAALKVNLEDLEKGGLLVVNEDAFNESNLKKAGYESNPLEDPAIIDNYNLVKVKMNEMTNEALAESPLKPSEKVRCKNFFALGFMYWIYDRPLKYSLKWIEKKWSKKEIIVEANSAVLKAGYYFGETCEIMQSRYTVHKAPVSSGVYRKISGNEAISLGLILGGKCCDRQPIYCSYPITPASSILESMAKYKQYGVKTVQAEDEIAAMGAAIGASYAGGLGMTATSGPGVCLKGEFMGLAAITELPVIIINVQRGGPSTGLPTKTEQADLLQAMFGRNGECPLPVVASNSPADCFDTAIEAVRIAIKYCTPVLVLSDGYIANGAEPWNVPMVDSLPDLKVGFAPTDEPYVTYKRDPETLARKQAIPGQVGLEHRIGGLEKNEEGSVSYDSENHEKMCELRRDKVQRIADSLPPCEVQGKKSGKLLLLGWGGTYGAIMSATTELQSEGLDVSSLHLRHLNPLPNDLEKILKSFDRVLVPELNHGQLLMLIRSRYLVDAIGFNKMQGKPFTVKEIKAKVNELLK